MALHSFYRPTERLCSTSTSRHMWRLMLLNFQDYPFNWTYFLGFARAPAAPQMLEALRTLSHCGLPYGAGL